MSNDITGNRMTIDFKNIQSNQTDATSKRSAVAPVSGTGEQKSETNSSAPSGDKVVLSDRAQVVQAAVSEISQPPKPNAERIEALRAAINSGQYSVSAESIASKLLTIDFGIRNQGE